MPQIYDVGPTALLPLWRKACWGFFRHKTYGVYLIILILSCSCDVYIVGLVLETEWSEWPKLWYCWWFFYMVVETDLLQIWKNYVYNFYWMVGILFVYVDWNWLPWVGLSVVCPSVSRQMCGYCHVERSYNLPSIYLHSSPLHHLTLSCN